MKVTKQKFYEQLILQTYRFAENTVIEDECVKLYRAGYDVMTMSFNELHLARTVIGLGEERFPLKQPFDKLGFNYFAQVTGFVCSSGNDELIDMYFNVLDRYPKLVDFSDIDQADFMYDVFLDNIAKNKDICQRLGSYLFKHAEKCDWYPDFLSVAYNLNMFSYDLSLDEIIAMRAKYPLE